MKDNLIKLNVKQQTPAWHKNKLAKIGATRYANITMNGDELGETAKKEVCQFLKEFLILNYHKKNFTTPAMRTGNQYEDVARRIYKAIHEDYIVKEIGMLIDPSKKFIFKYNIMSCSPDATVIQPTVDKDKNQILVNGLFEAKSLSSSETFDKMNDDKVSANYRRQLAWQLYVTGADFNDLVVIQPHASEYMQELVKDPEQPVDLTRLSDDEYYEKRYTPYDLKKEIDDIPRRLDLFMTELIRQFSELDQVKDPAAPIPTAADLLNWFDQEKTPA